MKVPLRKFASSPSTNRLSAGFIFLYSPERQELMDAIKWAKCPEMPSFRGKCLIHSLNKRILSISYVAGAVLGDHGASGEQSQSWPCPHEAPHLVGGMAFIRQPQITYCKFCEGKVFYALEDVLGNVTGLGGWSCPPRGIVE